MLITIYDKTGRERTTVSPSDSSTQTKEIQGDNVLSLSFTTYEHIDLDVDDYVEFEGECYWLTERYRPKQKSEREWSYDLKLYGVESMIKRLLVIKTVDGEDEPVFTLTAPPREHVAMIVRCMNNGMGNITDWKTGQVDGTENIVIDYFGKYCDEALKEIAEKVGAEWWVEGQTVNVCRCEHGEQIALGYRKGLLGLEADKADNVKFYTRLYPVGSSRNIDPDKYGFSRLQLPDGKKYVEINADKYGRVDHYEQDAFADIYPRRTGKVSSVRSEEKTGEDGEPFTIYYFKDDDLPFDPNDYELGGKVKRVSFQEGSELGGLGNEEDGTYFFEVNFNSDTREFEIITIWPYDDDTQLPGDKLIPKEGDEYILWNIRMPEEYYRLAEEEFLTAVEKYNEENALDVSVFKSSTNHVWIEDNAVDLFIGRRVRLESEEYFPETGYRDSRITKITRKVNLPTQMDIEIGDALSKTAMAKMSDSIEDARNYAKSIGESLSIPDIIRTGENTQPTDYNLFSARRSEREFLNKNKRDRARKHITFDEGIAAGEYQKLVSGAAIDPSGYGELESLLVRSGITTESLTVTKYAHFFELVIDRIKSAGGALLLTPANGFTVYSAEETAAGYKLRYLANDGDRKLSNDWRAGDQAICMTFNASTGTSYNASNKYYWALVTEAGTETVDGDDYHYIIISATDKDGVVNPEPGDEIAMLGYRGDDDPERQSAVYISAYNSIDTGIKAPFLAHYEGVNDFDLSAHRRTWIAANGSVFRGSLRVEDGTTIDEVLETKGKGYTSNLLSGTPKGKDGWSCQAADSSGSVQLSPWNCRRPYMAEGYTGVGLTVGGLGLTACSLHFRSAVWPLVAGKTYTLSFAITTNGAEQLDIYLGHSPAWADMDTGFKRISLSAGQTRCSVNLTAADSAATVGDYLYVTFNFGGSLKDYAVNTGLEIGDLKLEEGVNDSPAWTPAATDLVGATGATGATGADGKDGAAGKDGADGDSPYTLRLDNPTPLIRYDSAGDTPYDAMPTSGITVLHGNIDVTDDWAFAITTAIGGDAVIGGRKITFLEFNSGSDRADITVRATKEGETPLTAVMTVAKVPAGKDGAKGDKGDKGEQGIQGMDGAAAVMYALIPSASFIRKGFDGTVDPATLSCKVVKIVGGEQELSDEHNLTVQILPDGAVLTWPHSGGDAAAVDIPATATAVEIKLTHSDTNATLAQSRVPILSDAADIHQQWNEFQTDYNGLKSEVGSLTESGQHITRLEQTAESISMKVSDTPFSRNLLGGTNTGKSGWTTQATNSEGSVAVNPWSWENDNFTDNGPGIGITVGGKSLTAFNAVFKSTIDVDLKKDKVYLLSFVAGCAYQTDVMCYLSGPTATWAAMLTDFKTQVLSAGYGRYTFALTAKADYTGSLYVILAYRDRLTDWPDNAWLAVGDLQLESGTVPTAYSKAEADLRRLLLDTGIDIEAGRVTVTADKFVVNDNDGTPMSLIQLSEDGTPMIATGLLNVNSVEVYNGVFHKPDLDIAMSINRDGDKAYTIYQDSSKETVEDSDGTAYPKKVPQLVVKVAYVDEVTGKVLENTDNLNDAQQSVMQYYNRDGSMRWYLGPDGIVQLQLSTVTWTLIDVCTGLGYGDGYTDPRSTNTYTADYSFYRCNVPEGLQLEDEWKDKDGLAVGTAEVNGSPVDAGTYYAAKPRRLYYLPKTTTSSGVTSAYWGWVWARTKYTVTEDEETGDTYVSASDIQWVENEGPDGGITDR